MLELLVTEANPDRLHEYKDWGKELMGVRHHEAAISLQKEGVAREMAFAVKIDHKPYIVHVTEAASKSLPADMSMPVNQAHREKNRAVLKRDKRHKGEVIYDILV